MNCPNDNEVLERVMFHHVETDCCPKCMGIWFDKNELALAKNDRDKELNWLDFDIWRDKGKFEISKSGRQCPVCRAGLVEVAYDNSKVKIDFCKMCQGIWLDFGEFKQIIVYLKNKSDYEILNRYTKNFVSELWEVFAGPEKFRAELADFLTLLKLLNYKFLTQHPLINSLIENAPK
jgi:Zn-finger nucleic acid-binding protein